MPYVERDPVTHAIVGLYNSLQPGIAEEFLPDDNPEVQMFLHPNKTLIPTDLFVSRFTNAEYLKLGQQRAADIAAGRVGNSKRWDTTVAVDLVNVTNQQSQTLKTELVAAGILTQARADEIFSGVE